MMSNCYWTFLKTIRLVTRPPGHGGRTRAPGGRLFEMASSSSSSLHSQSSACPELPLIPCDMCNKKLSELASGQPESKGRKFYRCNAGCDFFRWQARYAVMLIRRGDATNGNQFNHFLMTALDDHSQGLESQSSTIKNMKKELERTKQELERTKQKLHNLEEFMKQELHDLKAAMVQNEQTKTSMASAMDLMKGDLQKLKGSGSKPRTLGMCSLGLLLLATLIGWFIMGLNGEEAFKQLMLSP